MRNRAPCQRDEFSLCTSKFESDMPSHAERSRCRHFQAWENALVLKHSYDLSDEGVCERWIKNPYWRHLTGGRVPSRALRHTSI